MILHCFSRPWRVADAIERGWYCSFSGIVTYPSDELREAAAKLRRTGSWSRPTPPTSRRSRCAASPTSRPTWSPRPRSSPRSRRLLRGAGAHGRGQRPRPLRLVAAMVRLGQNFLADPNLLDAIVRDAALGAGRRRARGRGRGRCPDRAPGRRRGPRPHGRDRPRPGAGAGADRRPAQRQPALGRRDEDRPGAFEPAPTAMVANLPYSVATPLILRTIEQLPSLASWTVMVQREIADRLRAAPGSRTYGSPSVVAQLACEVELVRKVDPAVFQPRPRVDSAILRLRRTGPGADPATRDLVRAAFAHRRKSLARSLEHGEKGSLVRRPGGAGRAGTGRGRAGRGARARAVRRPVREAARPTPDRRPEPMLVHAPAKLNLCLYLGPRRDDGLHELCSLFEPLALADLITVSEAERDEVICPGVEGENLAAAALAALRERGWERGAAAGRDREAGAGRGRPRWRQRRRGGDPAPRRRRGRRPRAAWRPSWAPTCPRSCIPRWPWSAAPASGSSRFPSRPPHAVVLLPDGGGLSTAAVFAEADRLGLGRDAGRARGARRRACAQPAGAGASPLSYPELLVNDLEPRRALAAPRDRRRARRAARSRRPGRPAQRLRPDRGRALCRPRRRPRRRRGDRPRRRDRLRGGEGTVRLPGEAEGAATAKDCARDRRGRASPSATT